MWEYSHEGKQLENKWVFRRLQKTGKVCADVKVKVRTLDIAPLRSESPLQKRSGVARVLKGFHSFTCTVHTHTFIHNWNEPYLPLPSQL